jgi:hypothetical protein
MLLRFVVFGELQAVVDVLLSVLNELLTLVNEFCRLIQMSCRLQTGGMDMRLNVWSKSIP